MRISADSVPQLSSATPARPASSAAVRSHVQLGAPVTSSTAFHSRCMLLLCVAAAGIVLAPKQDYRYRSAKARCNTARWSVAGFKADLPRTARLPDTSTDGSVPAVPLASATATPAMTLSQHGLLPEFGVLPLVVPPVAASEAPVHRGLTSARQAIRVGVVRCARRCGMTGNSKKAARPGPSRTARRAVGARLQPQHVIEQVPLAASFDPSRLRMPLQVGLQLMTRGNRPKQQCSFRLRPMLTGSVSHSRARMFSIIKGNNNSQTTMTIHSGSNDDDDALSVLTNSHHSCMLHDGGIGWGLVTWE